MPGYVFTDQTRTALALAQEEADRLRHDRLEPEHILLGLCHDEAIESILDRLGATPEAIRSAIEARLPQGDASPPALPLPYSPQARKVLEHAMGAARDGGDSFVRTEHLLVALHRIGAGMAAEILRRNGITMERLKPLLPEPERRTPRQFRVRIDDSSDRSIHEQIVTQITEAVATGELRPGDRLPTVRRQADQLDVAPGTVARAYGELERQGVVITEGVRGTRIADRTDPPVADPGRRGTLAGLLRPVAVTAFHLGASAAELRTALEEAMLGIFDKQENAG
jgi:DNA-binding transcriptional regulator YhcF (GntR family)